MFGANLVILAQICDELSCRQTKFPRILSQNGQNDLEGQGQWPPFSIPAKSIPGCMFGANLVIPAQICNELSCRQGKFTDGRMDRRRQWQYPFSLKGQGVIMTQGTGIYSSHNELSDAPNKWPRFMPQQPPWDVTCLFWRATAKHTQSMSKHAPYTQTHDTHWLSTRKGALPNLLHVMIVVHQSKSQPTKLVVNPHSIFHHGLIACGTCTWHS